MLGHQNTSRELDQKQPYSFAGFYWGALGLKKKRLWIGWGEKNHYGSRSQRGTEVAALFYSLIESAKLCGVDPKAYPLTAARAALADRAAVALPHDLLR